MKLAHTREWFEGKARREGDLEIAGGIPAQDLSQEDTAERRVAKLSLLRPQERTRSISDITRNPLRRELDHMHWAAAMARKGWVPVARMLSAMMLLADHAISKKAAAENRQCRLTTLSANAARGRIRPNPGQRQRIVP
jgi:hypothetical protein